MSNLKEQVDFPYLDTNQTLPLTIVEKAKEIRLLILDVDGILTNGIIYYLNNEEEMRGFHVHDGLGIKLLQKAGIQVGIISAKNSQGVKKRLEDLNIKYQYLGCEEKLIAYNALKQQLNLADKQIAYMGDDLLDLPVLTQVGLSVTVPEAPQIMHQYVNFTTKKSGGSGAVRELCDMILYTQHHFERMLSPYLSLNVS